MKRFYKLVSSQKQEQGWGIQLDGKAVRTPMRAELICANQALADAIVQEWAAQAETIEPDSMPLTQILSTQIDRAHTQREEMSAQIFKFLDTDLLCYRLEDSPLQQMQDQAKKQSEIWDPWLQWFEKHFGVKLKTTRDLIALKQPDAAHKAVQSYIAALDIPRFTVLQMVVPLCGSLVLSLAFIEGEISPKALLDAARIEEHYKDQMYNAEFYGRDPMQETKDAAILKDLEAAERYLKLI